MDSDQTEGIMEMGDHADAGTIRAIDRESVHRICSGQVVLTLATAVKELVENSIDAGATIIDVKLKKYGSELVEVTDNGSGVHKDNFHGLTLKHHTSKLQDFSDLVNVDTFGFRGEALSSLCALSELSVLTRHSSADIGTKLVFDHHGNITSRTPQARPVGTTVTMQNLFSTLPVRHKEFLRNLKKEFSKMVQVMNSYCIISTGVKITCHTQSAGCARSVVVYSCGNTTMKDNISHVFGSKQLNSMVEFRQVSPSEEVCVDYGVKQSGQPMFRIEGYVSKCAHGQGRSSADRQFFFINKRPCDSTKLSRVVNEVYHQFNRHQYPFVALHVIMAKEAVDVNVTPDKRQIFFQDEKLIMSTIKTSLLELYEPTASVLQMNNICSNNSSKSTDIQALEIGAVAGYKKKPNIGALGSLKRSFSSAFAKVEDKEEVVKSGEPLSKQRTLDLFVSNKRKHLDEVDGESGSSHCAIAQTSMYKSGSDDLIDLTGIESGISSSQETLTSSSQGGVSQSDYSEYSGNSSVTCSSETENSSPTANKSQVENILQGKSDLLTGSIDEVSACESNSNYNEISEVKSYSDSDVNQIPKVRGLVIHRVDRCVTQTNDLCGGTQSITDSSDSCNELSSLKHSESCVDTTIPSHTENSPQQNSFSTEIEISNEDECCSRLDDSSEIRDVSHYDELEHRHKREKIVHVNMDCLRRVAAKKQTANKEHESFYRNFRSQITPSDNQSAEEELKREITKDMFSKMEILGQFNLGFIIAKNGEDLFIVDQHATDEKYNFEMLQRHTVLQNQKLIQPQSLELTASNEIILMDNIEIFKKNGFEFIIDEQGLPTQRVKLVSTPVSKNWNFGKEDIEELIFMLTDSPGIMCRPSRVHQMFASRACRKSIMIGTALKKSEMKKLVSHMGDIEQPWNCPHGRPTMRHLINLNMVPR